MNNLQISHDKSFVRLYYQNYRVPEQGAVFEEAVLALPQLIGSAGQEGADYCDSIIVE